MATVPASSLSALSVSCGSTWCVEKASWLLFALLTFSQLTSSPPAFGLGLEKAAADLMRRPPHSTKTGVFSWPVILDCIAYGVVMGAVCLMSVIHSISSFFLPLTIELVRHRCLRQKRRQPRCRVQPQRNGGMRSSFPSTVHGIRHSHLHDFHLRLGTKVLRPITFQPHSGPVFHERSLGQPCPPLVCHWRHG